MVHLRLAKYHGLGNDFLVLVDWEREIRFDAPLATALCDRHRGLGADGLLRLSRPTGAGALQMDLRNADGSVAETSGNGLRCAALAAVHEMLVPGPEIGVETLAGLSRVEVAPGAVPGAAQVRVDMGALVVGPEIPATELPLGAAAGSAERAELASLDDHVARHVDIGNPHIVILATKPVAGTAERYALDRLGPALEAAVPGGVNVEVVSLIEGTDSLVLDVWERGAGITLACGSGSCAAAAAARASGIVGDAVSVVNPGGTLLVELSGELLTPHAVLTGPAQRVAEASVETDELVDVATGPAPNVDLLASQGRP
ncbi:MAG: diaminopimelate epimerase [Acidimicrobiaceae bacterium]|nr:diaminopimelate epimerase [Acidimicrobiaceae bacterium]